MKVSSSPKGFNGSWRSVENIFLLARQYQRRGVPFTLVGTNGAYRLHRQDEENSRYFSQFKNGLTPKELGTIRKVKNHILKEHVYLKFKEYLNPAMIKYVDIKKYTGGTTFNNVFEVDMDEAYWRAAYLLGVISKKIYEDGAKVNDEKQTEIDIKRRKMIRLISLGSLAKKQKKYVFSGKRIILQDTIVSDNVKLTQNIWYAICKLVSDIMLEAKSMLGDDYLMFWVDGIYFQREENVRLIQDFFKNKGFEVKTKKIPRIDYTDTTCNVIDLLEDEENNTRKFYLPKKPSKKDQFNRNKINSVVKKYSK